MVILIMPITFPFLSFSLLYSIKGKLVATYFFLQYSYKFFILIKQENINFLFTSLSFIFTFHRNFFSLLGEFLQKNNLIHIRHVENEGHVLVVGTFQNVRLAIQKGFMIIPKTTKTNTNPSQLGISLFSPPSHKRIIINMINNQASLNLNILSI